MASVSSNRIKDRKESILLLWEKRSLREVSAAGTAASLALRDSVPLYLDHLGESLDLHRKMDFKSVCAHNAEATRIGKMHGADRASNRSYLLTEVIFEYHILREVIFEVLEADAPLDSTQRDIILDSIEQAVNDAAVEFSEVHADIQQKFINTLTHDLQNPIAAAKMNAQLILKRVGTVDPNVASIKRIIGSLNRLTSMIHDLLDASRVRSGERLSLQFVQCDLNLVIHDVVDEMSLIHGDRFVLNSNEPVKGNWGCDGLRRASENLMSNAVKYGETDAPITVSLEREKTGIRLTVHNQGKPISATELPYLFQQYSRSKSADKRKLPGWGLGLTLVKGVVEAHQGKIRVESDEAKGTSFILDIPFAETTELPTAGLLRGNSDGDQASTPNSLAQ